MKSATAKILFFAALLIAAALAGAPKVIGLGIEQATIDSLLELIPPEAESQLEIRRNEFNDGWFSSSATIELLYTPIGTDAIALAMEFNIDHGPLLQTDDGLGIGLAFANITPSIRNDLFDLAIADLEFPLPEITFDLLARFDQSLRVNMNVSPVEYRGAEGELSFAGLESEADVAADQSARFAFNMGELSVVESAANSNILVSGLSLESVTAQMNDILADSSANLSIPAVTSTAPLPFSLSDIAIVYGLQGSATSRDNSEISQSISIAEIDGELPLQSFSWESEIKQLNNQLLRDYYRLLSELQSNMSSDPDAASAEMAELGQDLLLLTLQNPMELNNLIEMNAFDGDHSIDLRILWAGMNDISSVAELDTAVAIAALNITLVISLSLDAVLQSPLAGLVDPYVQQGYLTVTNGRVMVEATLQDSILRVNGDELPLDQFF